MIMTTYHLFRALVVSVNAFESKLRFEALASVARESVTGLPVEAVHASAVLLAANTLVSDTESIALAGHVAQFCTNCGIATMDVRDMLGGLAHMHILAARAVVSSIPKMDSKEMRTKLAIAADGLLRDVTYLMMGDSLAAPPPSVATDEPAPISGLRSPVAP